MSSGLKSEYDTPILVKIGTAIFVVGIILCILMGFSQCSKSSEKKVEALKQLTQALSAYSSEVNVKVEISSYGGDITVEFKDVDKGFLQTEEAWNESDE